MKANKDKRKEDYTSSWPSASMASEVFALPRVDLRALGIVLNNNCVCLFVELRGIFVW